MVGEGGCWVFAELSSARSKHGALFRCLGLSQRGLWQSLSLVVTAGTSPRPGRVAAALLRTGDLAGPGGPGAAGGRGEGCGCSGWSCPAPDGVLGTLLLSALTDLCPGVGRSRVGGQPRAPQPLSPSSPRPSTRPSGLPHQPLVFEDVKPLDARSCGLCRPEQT